MNSQTDGMTDNGFEMSNFDGLIQLGMSEMLQADQTTYGHHFAWNFCGRVWWDGEQFCEEVRVHRVVREVIREPTLPELMATVNERYGFE